MGIIKIINLAIILVVFLGSTMADLTCQVSKELGKVEQKQTTPSFNVHRELQGEEPPPEEGGEPAPEPEPTCESFEQDCTKCLANSSCILQNTWCVENNEGAIYEHDYYSYWNYQFCESATEDGQLILDNVKGETVELQPKANSFNQNQICEWDINITSTKTMTLQLERQVKGYEDMIIEYIKDGNHVHLSNRNLSSCTSTEYTLNLTGVSFLHVRAFTHVATSNYYILLAQEGKDFSYPGVFTRNKSLVEYVSIILITCFITIGVTTAVFALFRFNTPCFRTRMQKYRRRMRKLELKNDKTINKVMDNMVNGPFEELNARPTTPNCMICFEKFQGKENVHLLNECFHVFHSGCLKSWYQMVVKMSKLSCPDCSTHNTDHSVRVHSRINDVSVAEDVHSNRTGETPLNSGIKMNKYESVESFLF